VGDPAIKAAGRAMSRIAEVNPSEVKPEWGHPPLTFRIRSSQTHLMFEDKDFHDERIFGTVTRGEAAIDLLRLADPGIDGFDVMEQFDQAAGDPSIEPLLVHHHGNGPVSFKVDEESAGTQMLFDLLGPVLDALKHGEVLLFDEADASLHPRLSARLVQMFQDPQTNPYGAQLILATHDTSLLNTLNRDEVWLTEKSADGATQLVALAEFGGDKVRRSLNLERAYLQGRFGAVPEIDHTDVRQALGL
ncbi:MAG: ATP-binding protein, partial [Rhodobacteraceae bacterium]|nr:ATP-binding protein [Paracoccaceae bacterium]